MKVYVYKEFNDSYAYGEELIEVYAKREDAIAKLKKQVEEHFDNEYTFDQLLANDDTGKYIWDPNDDQMSDNYVSLNESGDGIFFIVEEHTVL